MGFLSDLVGAFTGSTARDAARAQEASLKEGQQLVKEGVAEATQKLETIFPKAQQQQAEGFQSAINLFSDLLPQQAQTYQQGNVQAQQSLLAGLPQMQNAILGAPVDYSGFQPQQVSFNPSALQGQQAIGYQTPEEIQASIGPHLNNGRQDALNNAFLALGPHLTQGNQGLNLGGIYENWRR